MKRFSTLALVACIACLVGGASADAKPCEDRNTVPPGNSEVDQYSETVPGDCGDRSPPAPNADDDPSASIPPATLAALEDLGADGRAAALLAAAGARENGAGGAVGSPGGEADSSGGPLGDTTAVLDADGGGFLDSVVDALSGEGGLGWILPLTLLVIVALAITAAVRNRRAA